jgi:hypothetical protein
MGGLEFLRGAVNSAHLAADGGQKGPNLWITFLRHPNTGYGLPMRRKTRAVGILLALVCAGAMAGCVGSPHTTGDAAQPPIDEPRTTLTPARVFGPDVLSDITTAYKRYISQSDLIAQDGGVNPERLQPTVSPDWLAHEIVTFGEEKQNSKVQIGNTAFDNVSIQSIDTTKVVPEVTAYLCLDVSSVQIIVIGSEIQLPPFESRRYSVLATFVPLVSDVETLVVHRMGPWPGEGFCGTK